VDIKYSDIGVAALPLFFGVDMTQFKVGDIVNIKATSQYIHEKMNGLYKIISINPGLYYKYLAVPINDINNNKFKYNDEDLELVKSNRIHSTGGNI